MSLYLDTSLLVTLLTSEPQSTKAQHWYLACDEQFTLSDWTKTEFSAALSIKLRRGELTVAGQQLALRSLAEMSMPVITVDRADFDRAARLADRYDDGLRAGDALHLAIAMDRGVVLCTRDKDQAAAAAAIGAAHQFV